jgi:hypothetical protein
MGPVTVSLPANTVDAAWVVYGRHLHDPLIEVCPLDSTAECQPFHDARAILGMAGALAWDPLREMARERAHLDLLADR